jgi:hypothetical protein
MTKKKLVIVLAGVVLMVAGAVTLWGLIKAPDRAAARNIAALNSLTVGQTTEAELLSRPQFQKVERMCIQETCIYHMEAQNTVLYHLRLAPRTFLRTAVYVRDGMVTGVSIFTSRAGWPGISVSQVEALPEGCAGSPCFLPGTVPHPSMAQVRIFVDGQSEVRNHMPETVNTECLSRLRGCVQYGEFVPLTKLFKLDKNTAGVIPGASK